MTILTRNCGFIYPCGQHHFSPLNTNLIPHIHLVAERVGAFIGDLKRRRESTFSLSEGLKRLLFALDREALTRCDEFTTPVGAKIARPPCCLVVGKGQQLILCELFPSLL